MEYSLGFTIYSGVTIKPPSELLGGFMVTPRGIEPRFPGMEIDAQLSEITRFALCLLEEE